MPYHDENTDEVWRRRYVAWRDAVANFDLDDEEFVWRHNLNWKIQQRALEMNIPEDEIRRELRTSRPLQWYLVNNQTRTNIGEAWAQEELLLIDGVENFDHRHPDAQNAQFVINGGVMTREDLERQGIQRPIATHSIDFTWNFAGREFFSTQKHTSLEEGGSFQTRVMEELLTWIREANPNSTQRVFVALVDGDFYTNERIATLRDACIENHNVFVCRIIDLDDFLRTRFA